MPSELQEKDPIQIEIPSETPAVQETKKPNPRRQIAMVALGIVFLGAAYKGYGAYTFGQSHVNTDNAYVTGDLVNISPTVSGTLAELKVSDGDFVHKGDLIARLDKDSSSSLLAQAQASLDAARAQVPQAEAELQYTKLSTSAAIQGSQAALQTQAAKTAGSRMQVRLSSDTVHNQILQAQAQVDQAKAQSQQAQSGVAEAEAGIQSAKLAVQTAQSEADAARSGEQSAQAEATRADRDLHRFQSLFRDEAVSQQQLDTAIAAAASSQANLSAATQKAQAAESQVAQAKSAVEEANSRLAAATNQALAASKQVQVARAALGLAQSGATQVGIQNSNVDTNLGQSSQAEAGLANSEAGSQQVTLREKQVSAAIAQLQQAKAAVENAKIQVRDAYLYAPCDGYVVKHTANVGTSINPGQTVVTITHGDDVWVMANFKETQLDKVKEGQPVEIEVDAYPGRVFKGKVLDIIDATGSATTLLPPDNSTGNFTKVVQRVPIKISIEPGSAGQNSPKLRQGMSVSATIDTGA